MSVLSDALRSLITERVTNKAIKKLEGDEGSMEFEDAQSLTKALLNLSKLESIENKKKLMRPIVSKITNPHDRANGSCGSCE